MTPKPVKKFVTVYADSIPKRIRPGEFNYYSKHQTKFRSFPGTNSKHLNHHVVPSLIDDKPQAVIIHCGTNDLQSSLSEEEIASQIINVGVTCKTHEVSKVVVSGIIYRANPILNSKRCRVNEILKTKSMENGFEFFDRKNLARHHLYRDGIYLLDSGIKQLANNYINIINKME